MTIDVKEIRNITISHLLNEIKLRNLDSVPIDCREDYLGIHYSLLKDGSSLDVGLSLLDNSYYISVNDMFLNLSTKLSDNKTENINMFKSWINDQLSDELLEKYFYDISDCISSYDLLHGVRKYDFMDTV